MIAIDDLVAAIGEVPCERDAPLSKKTTFVVAGEKAGSKLAKAEKLGVEILDFDQFLERLQGFGGSLDGGGA